MFGYRGSQKRLVKMTHVPKNHVKTLKSLNRMANQLPMAKPKLLPRRLRNPFILKTVYKILKALVNYSYSLLKTLPAHILR
jgi:hypothetical protein